MQQIPMANTESLYIDQPYLKECEAMVIAIDAERHAFSTDQSHFYARGGGQPGDSGNADSANGPHQIIDAWRDSDGGVWHQLDEQSPLPSIGAITLALDWQRRHRHMRMHSALHMLTVAVPAGVTSGAIHADRGRLDFDLPEPPDKEAIQARLNELIASAIPMTSEWLSSEQFSARDDLVKTLAVA
ncbi:alanyl-tRNA editing protein, partial [Gammaproteobacteria bacterium]|nr:alanyl-tRNA editing protein [Gammaproteobacteria bacterium]